MNLKPILFYHGDCPDGFGAAFSFWMKYEDSIDYVPVVHKREPFKGLDKNLFKDRKVWMVDFALEREDAIEAHALAKSFLIIDHHLSAFNHLSDLNFCQFDMKHSGAVLGWKHCFPNQPIPILLQYVETRDIYTWNLPYANEILAAVDAHERSFESWKELNDKLEDPTEFSKLLNQGHYILEYNKTLMEIIKHNIYYGEIKGHRVPIVNTPFFRSEILSQLSENEPFAAAYHYDGENFLFSLRSRKDGEINVAEIAEKFPGGGGHFSASGFSVKDLSEIK